LKAFKFQVKENLISEFVKKKRKIKEKPGKTTELI